MIRAAVRTRFRSRSGITLIEILISIMIMGIGVISIATLFPLGMIRLRNAQRLTRGAYLVESATADLGARNLMAASSFAYNPLVSPWYTTSASGFYNPLYQDTPGYGTDWGPPPTPANGFSLPLGANRYIPGTAQLLGGGLPIAYDPLWRAVTGIYQNNATALPGTEARFGSGIGFIRNEATGNAPHAYGLQRITNFQTTTTFTASASQAAQNTLTVLGTFISPEDLVLQDPKGTYNDPNSLYPHLQNPSTIVPAMNATATGPNYDLDWRYTWFFTGMQTDPSSTAVDGQIVICENRPFGNDTVNGNIRVSGETVVEAVWGSSSTSSNALINPWYGSASGSRSVYLRWPASQPDPDLRVGGWIADVTYERVDSIARTHYGVNPATGAVNGIYPAQRCFWYQVAKKTDINPETGGAYRGVTVWTTTPLQAMTLQKFNAGAAATPMHVEAALIMPCVVNVYPRTVYTR